MPGLLAVPWNAVEVDGENHALLFDISNDRLKQAPGFDQDNWPDFADPAWSASVHEFYGTRPYWETDLPVWGTRESDQGIGIKTSRRRGGPTPAAASFLLELVALLKNEETARRRPAL